MGILSDRAIRHALAQGHIEIDPFDLEQLNTASYDVRLGDLLGTYSGPGFDSSPAHGLFPGAAQWKGEHDIRNEPECMVWKISPDGVLLMPGSLYLMHTVERIATRRFVPIIDGKSSIGRLGISVHQTAGYGDPGFDGQFTLEVTTIHPIRIYPGRRFAQVRFHELCGEPFKLYDGNYKGETSRGPVKSRAWRMFRK